jgi:purine-nucleoside phosphorylase
MDANQLAEQEHKDLVESYGGKAVGLTFNPSNLIAVDVIKTRYASIINDLDQTRADAIDGEVKRLCSVAITEAQTAQMWAVKALTWGLN